MSVAALYEEPDQEIRLLIPLCDSDEPELSIVIPALDEQLTIAEFVGWCHEGLAKAGVSGEIVIVDSSRDETEHLALKAGARVLHTPRRGLGRAYKDAIPYVRGRYLLMGDADCTYDFRHIEAFVESFREGYEFVMGSRWKGTIESGAMPWLHRRLGTPVTTGILNRLFRSCFSDIHCGMRGITRDGLIAMDLDSDSWEYASEMVLKSVQMGLRTTEVPVRFLKDRNGRLSHHKRAGWFSPWQAAWINLRSMFVYGSDYFLLKPGMVLFSTGLLLILPLSVGTITIAGVTFSLYWMLFGMALTITGMQAFLLGCIAQSMFDYHGRVRQRWLAVFPYTRTVICSFLAALAGLGCIIPLIFYYLSHRETLSLAAPVPDHLAVVGLLLIIIGFSFFTFTLVLQGLAIVTRRSDIALRLAATDKV
jgi:glycosyltransferase involved in cell wall biosynthesis